MQELGQTAMVYGYVLLGAAAVGHWFRARRLKRQMVELQRRKDEAESALQDYEAAKGRRNFYLTLSHELRTPLQVILTAVQHQENICETGDRELYYQKGAWTTTVVKSNVYRLLRLSGNLVDINRLDAGDFPIRREWLDVERVVGDVVEGVRPYFEDRQIQLTYAPEGADLHTILDQEAFERILLNLLSNGLKFTPRGGAVRVRTVRDQITGDVVIAVRDTGPGMPPGDMERIFDKYVQLNSELIRTAEGNGLGLALVKQLMAVMGGRVEVTNLVGAGSEFRLRIPALAAENADFQGSGEHYRETLAHRIRVEFEEIGG